MPRTHTKLHSQVAPTELRSVRRGLLSTGNSTELQRALRANTLRLLTAAIDNPWPSEKPGFWNRISLELHSLCFETS
jgi:hypothetical protein